MSKVLITGTSRGLGRSLANEFTKREYQVIATARSIDDLKDLKVYKKISLDVTNEEEINRAADECREVDILINNAAYTVGGPIEVIPIEEIKKEYDTNVFGPLRLIRKFIPGMRKAGKGIIVNISSAADRFAPPYGGSYASAKAALGMISEALHFELRHFGIKVILIESGAINTDMPKNQKHFSSSEYQVLENQMKLRAEKYFKETERPSPEEVALKIVNAIENPNSELKVPIGIDAEYLISMRQKMSDSEWEKHSPLLKDLDW